MDFYISVYDCNFNFLKDFLYSEINMYNFEFFIFFVFLFVICGLVLNIEVNILVFFLLYISCKKSVFIK